MNRKQVEGMLNMINAAYPHYYRNMNSAERQATLVLWCNMFAADDSAVVAEIVRRHIATSKYPPTIAEIRAGIRAATMASPQELFEILVRYGALSHMTKTVLVSKGTGSQADTYTEVSEKDKAYDNLPQELKRYVKDADGLVKWYKGYRQDKDGARGDFNRKIGAIQEEIDLCRLRLAGGV